ncbi:hypothetical protein [Alkaliphilus sp. B6464]|uniref:hypothetical protein n=1 Tax=Alkaliphilus sp. B6464 TaxID=2731219 RepID=UPI001BA5D826|nr:hypothetical protein [Alkaliphilus sp. B6464]QUH18869.1 hypothetical protein HYG84_02370 [Alkaliphilus sp. B6464]
MILYSLKNEFVRYTLESKNYGMDFISGKIGDMIYLSGLLFALYYSAGSINLSMVLRFLTWYILYNSMLNAVSDVESEIRADYFKNLIYTKTSIWKIYLYRFFVYSIESILVLIVSLLFMSIFIPIELNSDLKVINILYYIFLSTVLNIIIYCTMISLTLIFERIMTFATLFMTFVLFLSGMVFNFNNIFSNMIFSKVSRVLTVGVDISILIRLFLLLVISYIFKIYTNRKIYS